MEEEILQAQAQTLGRTGERLQRLLDRLATLDGYLDRLLAETGGPTDSAANADLVHTETEARNRLRDEALHVRHHLIIQREALGLARQTPVEQCYPVPARRRAGEIRRRDP
jgi:hypothetical protein